MGNVKEVGGDHRYNLQDLKQMPCRINLKPLYHILTVIIEFFELFCFLTLSSAILNIFKTSILTHLIKNIIFDFVAQSCIQ